MYKNIKNFLKRKTIRLFNLWRTGGRFSTLYKKKEYLEAYSIHTDLRVKVDPKKAVGGNWKEMGQLQYKFLIQKNMQPNDKMLDIGCGTLRGGRHFIKYLDNGNYYGMDISAGAIDYAEQLVQKEGLSEKQPHLILSENKDLKFQEFIGNDFDYILAQSVFTHLKPKNIEECFKYIGRIMHEDSAFYFTYFKGEDYSAGIKDYRYPFSFFESLADNHGFKLQDFSKEYHHPKGQIMVELKKL